MEILDKLYKLSVDGNLMLSGITDTHRVIIGDIRCTARWAIDNYTSQKIKARDCFYRSRQSDNDRECYDSDISDLDKAIAGIKKLVQEQMQRELLDGLVYLLGYVEGAEYPSIIKPNEWAILKLDYDTNRANGNGKAYLAVRFFEAYKLDDLSSEEKKLFLDALQSVEPSPKAQDSNLTKLDKQRKAIMVAIKTKQYQPLAIPDGGKGILKTICENDYPDIFDGDTSFNNAWKNSGHLFKMANHASYSKRGKS